MKLIHAMAINSDESIPANAEAKSVRTIIVNLDASLGRRTITIAPAIAPNTMIPSSPRLMIPLRSENIPPKATRISTAEKISVY